jgi:hypothetical protein
MQQKTHKQNVFSPFWLVAWSVTCAISWLLPNHYRPWLAFHMDTWASMCMLIAAFAVLSVIGVRFQLNFVHFQVDHPRTSSGGAAKSLTALLLQQPVVNQPSPPKNSVCKHVGVVGRQRRASFPNAVDYEMAFAADSLRSKIPAMAQCCATAPHPC